MNGLHNDAFSGDDGSVDSKEKSLKMLLRQKNPLEKALSMPDMQNKMKKRERIMA